MQLLLILWLLNPQLLPQNQSPILMHKKKCSNLINKAVTITVKNSKELQRRKKKEKVVDRKTSLCKLWQIIWTRDWRVTDTMQNSTIKFIVGSMLKATSTQKYILSILCCVSNRSYNETYFSRHTNPTFQWIKKLRKKKTAKNRHHIYVQQRLCLTVLAYMPNSPVLLKRLLNAEKEWICWCSFKTRRIGFHCT